MICYTASEYVNKKLEDLEGRLNQVLVALDQDSLDEIDSRLQAMWCLAAERPEFAQHVNYLQRKVDSLQAILNQLTTNNKGE